jgi:DNA-binding transcriptional LysR family regulator
MLPRIFGEFKSAYPNVRSRLVVGNSESIESRVMEHTIDIGFIESLSHQPSLECDVCCDDELVVICAPHHRLAKSRSVTPQEVPGADFAPLPPASETGGMTGAPAAMAAALAQLISFA